MGMRAKFTFKSYFLKHAMKYCHYVPYNRLGSIAFWAQQLERTVKGFHTALQASKACKGAVSKISKTGEECISILDDDCWRVILDYVELSDVIRSERVSKQWQQIVHQYLQGIRLCLRVKAPQSNVPIPTTREWHVPIVKCRDLDIYEKHHIQVIEKYGWAIVAADVVDCIVLKPLGRHCPDLMDLRVIGHYQQPYRIKQAQHFSSLRRVSFHNVIRLNDGHISQFFSSRLEELTISHNILSTGGFLRKPKNLKYLKLTQCTALKEINNLLSASLSELTTLELQSNEIQILQNVFKLIEKTPKLEYFGLVDVHVIADVGRLAEAIGRLSRLKHLNLRGNRNVDNSFLETVGRCCGQLRTVNIGNCHNVTSVGVLEMCRGAGKTLTALDVSHKSHLNDDDMALCIRLCPKLEFLNLWYSHRLSPGFAAAASRARAGRGGAEGGGGGRLRLVITPWEPQELTEHEKELQKKQKYDNLILVEEEKNLNWENYLKE